MNESPLADACHHTDTMLRAAKNRHRESWTTGRRARRRSPAATWFGVLLLLVVTQQWRNGAFRSEFGAHPDEAAHYVTGLMAGDFLISGRWHQPLAFAEEYYSHYPKVALGNWPPVFYAIQAPWYLCFGPGRASAMVLMALTAAAAASAVFLLLRREADFALAAAGSLVFLSLPAACELSCHLMSEMLVTLLCLIAAVSWHGYLERPSGKGALCFGAVASMAIMTKGSGLLLAVYAVLLVAMHCRWSLLRRPHFYLAPLLVVLVCAPWHVCFFDTGRQGWVSPTPTLAFTSRAATFYPGCLLEEMGPVAGALMLLGVCGSAVSWLRGKRPGISHAMTCLLVAVILFHLIVPCGHEGRHLMPAVAAGTILALCGLRWVSDLIVVGLARILGSARHLALSGSGRTWLRKPLWNRSSAVLQWSVVILLVVGNAKLTSLRTIPNSGFRDVAEHLYRAGADGHVLCLVSSDPRGEGMLIAELATLDSRDRRTHALRASKTLAQSDWRGDNVVPYHHTLYEVREFLQRYAVDFVVIDDSIRERDRRQGQHNVLLEAVADSLDEWELVHRGPRLEGRRTLQRQILVYRRCSGNERRSKVIPLFTSLGRRIDVRLP